MNLMVKLLLEKGANSVRRKNSKGETALDIVSKEWNPQLEATYQGVGRSLNRKFDLNQLQNCPTANRRLTGKSCLYATTNDSAPAK